MSNKTIAVIVVGFIGVFLVGLLIGALTIKAFYMPASKVKVDEHFEKAEIIFARSPSTGTVIVEVLEDSPAEEAGLAEGDVILSVDGEDVSGNNAFADVIRSYDAGDEIELLVVRGKEKLDLSVTLGEHPEDEDIPFLGVVARPFMRGSMTQGLPGERFTAPHHGHMDELMPFEHHEFEFRGMEGPGLMLMHVAEGSPAEESDLQPADVILSVDGEEITNFEQFAEIIGAYEPGDEITLEVLREGEDQEIQVTLGKHPEDPEKAYLGVMGFGIHEFMPDKMHPGLKFENQG